MAIDRKIKFTEADIKLFTKVQEHTNMKIETSRLKTIQGLFLAN